MEAQELGRLSAQYESARAGSFAIGCDSAGGASYGRFQIATKVGTMDAFLSFCSRRFPLVHERLNRVRSDMGDRHGVFARTWIELAEQRQIQQAEYEFIFPTHYTPSYDRLDKAPQEVVNRWASLREVLWSTAVQHGPGGAPRIFNFAAGVGLDRDDKASVSAYVVRIYDRRRGRLARLTEREQTAVSYRYDREQADALKMLEAES